MFDMILKGADGKSGLITMETLSSDVARILPTFKIALILGIIASVSGYLRMLVIGFHPILQAVLLGLLMGTVAGKLLRFGEQAPKQPHWQILISISIGLAFLLLHYLATGWALPHSTVSFLAFSWLANDMREIPQLIPSLGIGSMEEATNRTLWLCWVILDALLFIASLSFAFRQAIRVPQAGARKESRWGLARLLVLALAFYGSAAYAKRDAIQSNQRMLANWTDEVGSHHYLKQLFEHEDAIQAPPANLNRIALEEALQGGTGMDREFPEGHLLQSLEQLAKGNTHYARDELGRAILEAEQMDRRTWMQDGTPFHRDLLLAHLYQLRAKIALRSRQYLLAERDLTVAIIVHREFWMQVPGVLEQGLFTPTRELLVQAGYAPQLGFAACHYERYLTRIALNDPEQAAKDLAEAKDLGFEVPEAVE